MKLFRISARLHLQMGRYANEVISKMKKQNSVGSMVWLDIKRGICNKRFWIVEGIFAIVFIALIFLQAYYPIVRYQKGYGSLDWFVDGLTITAESEIISILGLQLFGNFFPFIGALAFAYSIIDDWKDKYYQQIIQRNTFKKYYWSRFYSSGIMGGILAVSVFILLIFLAEIGIDYNPFIHNTIQFFKKDMPMEYTYSIYFGAVCVTENCGFLVWMILGAVSFFLVGTLFGMVAALVGFRTDNRVMLYASPVIFVMLYEKWIYVMTLLLHKWSFISNLLSYFYIRENYSFFGYGIYYFVLIFLIALMVVIAKRMEHCVSNRYLEEEE